VNAYIDGNGFSGGPVLPDGSWTAHLGRQETGWSMGKPETGTRKRLGLQGPIDDASWCVPDLVYPNPLHPDRYVVLNSGFTFAPYGNMSNAMQTPKLPDWAVQDVRVPAGERVTSGVRDCDFSDEHWRVKTR
jgi:hypothetical protein